MTRTPTKKKPRRRRRSRHRVGWFRGLAGELLGVRLGTSHRYFGKSLAGYRLVRIVRAKVDRKRREVVLVVARLCDAGGGFDGPKVTITDRREFVGGRCCGVDRGGGVYVPVDDVYRERSARRTPGETPAAPPPVRPPSPSPARGSAAAAGITIAAASTHPPTFVPAFPDDSLFAGLAR